MPKLPSPIPHPLSFLDAPGWLREALEWVVGVDWPAGDEKAMRQLADAWYEAGRRVGPLLEESDRAALEAVAAFGGPEGEAAQALLTLWRKLGGSPEAVLIQVHDLFDDLGEFVDGTANDIEGVKLEFYIELLLMLAELLILVATAAVSGGTSLAGAGPIMMATRFAIQRILRRAADQIIKRAVKKALRDKLKGAVGDRLKEGIGRFGLRTAREGMEEGFEELGTTAATQGYQVSEGNRAGLDPEDLVLSFGVGTLAGSVANVTSIGGIRAGGAFGEFGERSLRGAAGELLADVTVGVVTGQDVTWTSMGMAAASGTAGSMVGAGQHVLDSGLGLSHDVMLDALSEHVGAEAATGSGTATLAGGADALLDPAAPASASALVAGDIAGAAGREAQAERRVQAEAGIQAEARAELGEAEAKSRAELGEARAESRADAEAGVRTDFGVGPAAQAGVQPGVGPESATLTGGPTATIATPPIAGPIAGPMDVPVSPGPSTSTTPQGPPPQATAVAPGQPSPAPPPRTAQPPAGAAPDTAPPQPTGSAPADFEPFLVVTPTPRLDEPKPFVPEIRPGVPAVLVDDPEIRRKYADHVQIEIHTAIRRRLMEFVETLIAQTTSPGRRRRLTDDGIAALTQADIQPIADELWTIANLAYRNNNWGFTTSGVNDKGTVSLATGRDVPPAVESTRRYGRPGTYNPPLSLHQQDVELAIPRDADGVPQRFADLYGNWLRLVNDGGPRADLCRSINCTDVVLSLLDTWMHGRPRVAAPRTYDRFTLDDMLCPLGGELNGTGRIEATTGATFQTFESDREGFLKLEAVLRDAGHGSCAVLVQERPNGIVHASTVHNQNGEILYVDAQNPDAALTGRPVGAPRSNIIVLRPDSTQIDLGTPRGIWSMAGAPDPEGAPSAWSAPGIDPRLMLRDPTPEQLRALNVGAVSSGDLGLTDADLRPHELDQLPRVAMVNPRQLNYTQRSVSPATSDGVVAAELEQRLAAAGWRGSPVHAVLWGDGSLASLDHRRVRAAERANLPRIPVVIHSPSDPISGWGESGEALADAVRRLPDGGWVAGGDEGEPVFARGAVPQTCGQAAIFRAASQRSLLPGHLFGTRRLPVTLAKPDRAEDPPDRDSQAGQLLLRMQSEAEAQARSVEAYLATLGYPLRKQETKIKSYESLARKLRFRDADQTNASAPNDVLRFTIELPDGTSYTSALDKALRSMTESGYEAVKIRNYWTPGNRFYGVNAVVRAPSRYVFELQFGTQLSLRADAMTHELFEVMRKPEEAPARRVHALLWMLSINQRLDLANSIPPDLGDRYPAAENNLAKWIHLYPETWDGYVVWLNENLRGLRGILAEFGLTSADLPISPRLSATMRKAHLGVLRDLQE